MPAPIMPPIPIIVTSSSFKSLLSVIFWRDGLPFKVPPPLIPINKTTSFEPLVVLFGHSPENITAQDFTTKWPRGQNGSDRRRSFLLALSPK
jgi:hypothetical protein